MTAGTVGPVSEKRVIHMNNIFLLFVCQAVKQTVSV